MTAQASQPTLSSALKKERISGDDVVDFSSLDQSVKTPTSSPTKKKTRVSGIYTGAHSIASCKTESLPYIDMRS